MGIKACTARQYEMNSSMSDTYYICNGFNGAYNEDCGEYSYQIPQELGNGQLRQLSNCRNTRIIEFDTRFEHKFELNGISRVPHMDMIFCLGEDVYWELPQIGKNFEMLSGESYIGTSQENVKRCIYPAQRDIHLIEIKMPLNEVENTIAKIHESYDFDYSFLKNSPFGKFKITPSIQIILQQMLKCPYKASLKKLYMEGKLLELIAVYLNETVFQYEKVSSNINLSSEDIKSIHKAKEILDEELVQTLPLKCLSKRVCLNEFKLKKGFKELFGVPVHTYVLDKRLELARFLLEEKKLRVSDVAGSVGYGNMSHFAAAFRKKYGVNPGDYLQHIKNIR